MWLTKNLNNLNNQRATTSPRSYRPTTEEGEAKDLREPESDDEMAVLLQEDEHEEEDEGDPVEGDRKQGEDPRGSRPSPKTLEEPEELQKVYKMVTMSICLPWHRRALRRW